MQLGQGCNQLRLRGKGGGTWNTRKCPCRLNAICVVGRRSHSTRRRGAVGTCLVKVGLAAAHLDACTVLVDKWTHLAISAVGTSALHALGHFIPFGCLVFPLLAILALERAGVVEGGAVAGECVRVARGAWSAVGAVKVVLPYAAPVASLDIGGILSIRTRVAQHAVVVVNRWQDALSGAGLLDNGPHRLHTVVEAVRTWLAVDAALGVLHGGAGAHVCNVLAHRAIGCLGARGARWCKRVCGAPIALVPGDDALARAAWRTRCADDVAQ